MAVTVKPRNLVSSPMFLCTGRPRRCERIDSMHCTSCGWWGSQLGDGGMDLFDQPEHTDQECERRQLDPRFQWEQDNARLVAAGLPGLPPPRPGPR